MEVYKAIRERRSIRKFKEGEVAPEDLEKVLEAAMMAPSARNMRPYEFYVVKNGAKRAEIAAISPNFRMVKDAAAAIVVCGRLDIAAPLGYDFWVQDCAAATENILLQAKELGYGTCWCGTYPVEERVEKVSAALEAAKDTVPFAVIAIGVPDEKPAAKGFYDKTRVHII